MYKSVITLFIGFFLALVVWSNDEVAFNAILAALLISYGITNLNKREIKLLRKELEELKQKTSDQAD